MCRIVHDDLSTYQLDLTDDLLKDLGGKDRKDSSSILFLEKLINRVYNISRMLKRRAKDLTV